MAVVHLIVGLRVEDPSQGGLHAQHREVIARDHLGLDALGTIVDADRRADETPANHLRERLRARLVVLIDRIGVHPGTHVAAVVRSALIEHDELFGRADRQLPKEELVDQREDRRVGANSQRER